MTIVYREKMKEIYNYPLQNSRELEYFYQLIYLCLPDIWRVGNYPTHHLYEYTCESIITFNYPHPRRPNSVYSKVNLPENWLYCHVEILSFNSALNSGQLTYQTVSRR